MVKAYFKENGIKFEDIDVTIEKNANEMIAKTGLMTIPVIEINGKIIVGYNIDEIKKLLGDKSDNNSPMPKV
jgi:glutaredoxin